MSGHIFPEDVLALAERLEFPRIQFGAGVTVAAGREHWAYFVVVATADRLQLAYQTLQRMTATDETTPDPREGTPEAPLQDHSTYEPPTYRTRQGDE